MRILVFVQERIIIQSTANCKPFNGDFIAKLHIKMKMDSEINSNKRKAIDGPIIIIDC